MLHSFVITGVWHIPLKIINFLLRCTVTRNIHFFIAYNKLIALKDSKTALDMKCCSPIFIIRSVIRKHQIKQITGPSVTYDVFPLNFLSNHTSVPHILKPTFLLSHRFVASSITLFANFSNALNPPVKFSLCILLCTSLHCQSRFVYPKRFMTAANCSFCLWLFLGRSVDASSTKEDTPATAATFMAAALPAAAVYPAATAIAPAPPVRPMINAAPATIANPIAAFFNPFLKDSHHSPSLSIKLIESLLQYTNKFFSIYLLCSSLSLISSALT